MNLFTAAETTANYSNAGAGKTKLPVSKMLLLGILAGFLIGVPACVTNMATYGLSNNSMVRMVSGLLFAFGLGTVVMTGAELFTGNTLITISVLDKKATVAGMLKNWVFVYIGNFIGSLLLAVICANFGWLSAGSNALAAASMKAVSYTHLEKGLRLRHFGEVLYFMILDEFSAVVDKCQITLVTDPAEAKRILEE